MKELAYISVKANDLWITEGNQTESSEINIENNNITKKQGLSHKAMSLFVSQSSQPLQQPNGSGLSWTEREKSEFNYSIH